MEARVMNNEIMQSVIDVANEYTSRNEIFPLKRRITQQDVANATGLTRACVSAILNPKEGALAKGGLNIPEHTVARVRKTAKELGYEIKAERVKAEDVAKGFGKSIGYMKDCLMQNPPRKCPLSFINTVRAYADAIGYKSYKPHNEATKRAPHRYWGGNFATHADERARMLELRADGYSNHEIAKKVGRSTVCVLNNIGPQPEEITAIRRKLQGQKIRETNAAHKEAVRVIKRKEELGEKLTACRQMMENIKIQAEEFSTKIEHLDAQNEIRVNEMRKWNTEYNTARSLLMKQMDSNADNMIFYGERLKELNKEAAELGMAV